MSFARVRARKYKKARNRGYEKGGKICRSVEQISYRSYVEQLKAEEIYRQEVTMNLWIIYQYTMIERYHFGAERLTRLRKKAYDEFESIREGYISVREIDQFLRSDLKFSCGLSTIDIKASRWKQIEDRIIREISAAFLMACLDEFGIKSRGLVNICHHAFGLNDKIESGEITYQQMADRIKEVMARPIRKRASQVQ